MIFAGASIWAAYAGDADQLIAARAAMGVGTALITPAGFAVLLWTFTGPTRATAIAISSTSIGAGMAAGPVWAGLLLSRRPGIGGTGPARRRHSRPVRPGAVRRSRVHPGRAPRRRLEHVRRTLRNSRAGLRLAYGRKTQGAGAGV
nr:hypothetical protein [Streptomyces diacarni]